MIGLDGVGTGAFVGEDRFCRDGRSAILALAVPNSCGVDVPLAFRTSPLAHADVVDVAASVAVSEGRWPGDVRPAGELDALVVAAGLGCTERVTGGADSVESAAASAVLE